MTKPELRADGLIIDVCETTEGNGLGIHYFGIDVVYDQYRTGFDFYPTVDALPQVGLTDLADPNKAALLQELGGKVRKLAAQ